MMKFKVPVELNIEVDVEVEADSMHEACDVASALEMSSIDLTNARPRGIGIVMVSQEFFSKAMKEIEPPDPMEAWDCLREPGPYEGGLWEKKVDEYVLVVIGDDGPIDVGMSFPTYTWKIRADRLPYDIESKKEYRDKVECKDDALKALDKVRKI